MAEHDLVKHSNRIYRSIKSNQTVVHKILEIIGEVCIIVFAILVSLYLKNLNEKSHNKDDEKEFLLGLANDLTNDIKELEEDSTSYQWVHRAFNYFYQYGSDYPPKVDSLKYYKWTLFNTTDLIPNNSRFEGLKGSGRLSIIENEHLLNDILDLYQEKIPALLSSTKNFSDFKRSILWNYIDENLIAETESSNWNKLFRQNVMRNYLQRQSQIPFIITNYHNVLQQCRLIKSQIRAKYNLDEAP